LLRFNLLIRKDIQKFDVWLKTIFRYCFALLRMLDQYQDFFTQHDLRDTVQKTELQEGFETDTPSKRTLFDVNMDFMDSLNDIQPAEEDSTLQLNMPEIERIPKEMVEEFFKHILSILHFYCDLGVEYLTTNFVEAFRKKVKKSTGSVQDFTEIEEFDEEIDLNRYMPEAKSFRNHLEYEFPSLITLYGDYERY
jgi:uncharacterized protein YfbU (UPF0304 family)